MFPREFPLWLSLSLSSVPTHSRDAPLHQPGTPGGRDIVPPAGSACVRSVRRFAVKPGVDHIAALGGTARPRGVQQRHPGVFTAARR